MTVVGSCLLNFEVEVQEMSDLLGVVNQKGGILIWPFRLVTTHIRKPERRI